MVEGGPIDVLTGDYLAEPTMLILWKARRRDPSAGSARSVLGQLEHVLGTCLDRGTASGMGPEDDSLRLDPCFDRDPGRDAPG